MGVCTWSSLSEFIFSQASPPEAAAAAATAEEAGEKGGRAGSKQHKQKSGKRASVAAAAGAGSKLVKRFSKKKKNFSAEKDQQQQLTASGKKKTGKEMAKFRKQDFWPIVSGFFFVFSTKSNLIVIGVYSKKPFKPEPSLDRVQPCDRNRQTFRQYATVQTQRTHRKKSHKLLPRGINNEKGN